MLQVTDTTFGTVCVQFLIISILRTEYQIELSGSGTGIFLDCFLTNIQAGDAIPVYFLSQRHSVYTAYIRIHQAAFGKFAHNGNDTACTIYILYMIFLGIGSYFTQARSLTRQHIDIIHCEIRSGFMGYRQQMKHRIGRTAHCNIQCHGIQKSFTSGNAAGKYAFISFLVILISVFNNQFGGIFKQFLTIFMSSHNRTITRKRQPDSFVQTVHGIGGKHTRATSASGTSVLFNLGNLIVTHALISRLNHSINQIEVLSVPFSGFHRTSGNEYRRDVQPHRSHEHTRSNLVAIADADHGIRLMRIHHILHTIGYNIA